MDALTLEMFFFISKRPRSKRGAVNPIKSHQNRKRIRQIQLNDGTLTQDRQLIQSQFLQLFRKLLGTDINNMTIKSDITCYIAKKVS